MKKYNKIVILLIIVFLFISWQGLVFGKGIEGNFKTYFAKNLEQNKYDIVNKLNLKYRAGIFNRSVYLDGNIEFSAKSFSEFGEIKSPINTELNELYLDLWYKKGQIKIGKQRIAWGSGYFYNPTDVINPADRESINYQKEETATIYGSYYLPWGGTLEGVFVTDFQAVGPKNDKEANSYAQKFNPYLQGQVNMPEGFKEEKEYALRYSRVINNIDLSLVHYNGREDSPLIRLDKAQSKLSFAYPEKRVWGVDLSTSLAGIGLWGEVTYNNSKQIDSYLKGVIGADYTFPSGLHLMGEYFRDESFNQLISMKDINADYVAFSGDYNLTELVKITGMYMFQPSSELEMVGGEIKYSLAQDWELKSGINKVQSPENSFIEKSSMVPFTDEIYVTLNHYF